MPPVKPFKEQLKDKINAKITSLTVFKCPKCSMMDVDKLKVYDHYVSNHKIIEEL